MFEIPDDDEEFWENLPLGDSLPQFNTISQAQVESNKSGVVEQQPRKDANFPASLDSGRGSPVILFQGNNQELQRTDETEMQGKPVPSENLATHDMQKPDAGAETLHDIFNLTQSSEFDLELSLTFQSETGSKEPEEQMIVRNTSVASGNQMSPEAGIQNKGSFGRRANSVSVLQTFNRLGSDSPYYGNKSVHTNRIDTCHPRDQAATCHFLDVSTLPQEGHAMMGQPERKSFGHIEEVHVDANRADLSDGKSKMKRKFPGPAGLLPRLVPGQDLQSAPVLVLNVPKSPKKQDIPIAPSQSSAEDVFLEAPWKMLQHDLGEDGQLILKKFSIADTVSKARLKHLPNGKVPLLFVVVETLDIQGTDGFVVLRDKTGKMQGTAHRELLKESELQFQQGVVLVLKQVGVISPSQRTHYLNITPSNVVSVYRSNGDGTARVTQGETENLLQVVSAVETQLTQLQSVSTPKAGQLLSLPGTPIQSVLQSPTLFQNVHSSPGVGQVMTKLGSPLVPQSGWRPSKTDQVFKVPQSTSLTPSRHLNKPGMPQYRAHTCHQVPFSPAHRSKTWTSPNRMTKLKHQPSSVPSTPPYSLSSPLASSPAVRPAPSASGNSDSYKFCAQPQYQHPSPRNATMPVPQYAASRPASRVTGGQSNNKAVPGHSSPSTSAIQRSPLQAIPTYATLPNSSDSSEQSLGNATTPLQCSKSKWTFKSKRSSGVGSPHTSTGVTGDWQRSPSDVSLPSFDVGKRTSVPIQLPAKLRAKAASLGSPSLEVNPPPSKSRRPNFAVDQSSFTLDVGHQSGHSSAFSPRSFKEVAPCDTPLELNTSLAGRNPTEMNVDSLWPDDLTDEFLTDLTADDFP
ncbi:uncharacterized protein LOC135471335 [Liolophura sinensis]|uniref:uncharacterized protein LOC135471335 n=1 Tax=Liolophura sinensis TaxID=3198878 RepID=UPI003158CB78